ncbi:MAG: hypothetical protein P8J20_05400 [Novosphingobium sp.]|nr:hypothetical protein [Novosphingobium sp.]
MDKAAALIKESLTLASFPESHEPVQSGFKSAPTEDGSQTYHLHLIAINEAKD